MSEAVIHAAGPWRDDVENAPRDGRVFIFQDKDLTGFAAIELARPNEDGTKWHVAWADFMVPVANIIAFAEINPPETKP